MLKYLRLFFFLWNLFIHVQYHRQVPLIQDHTITSKSHLKQQKSISTFTPNAKPSRTLLQWRTPNRIRGEETGAWHRHHGDGGKGNARCWIMGPRESRFGRERKKKNKSVEKREAHGRRGPTASRLSLQRLLLFLAFPLYYCETVYESRLIY